MKRAWSLFLLHVGQYLIMSSPSFVLFYLLAFRVRIIHCA
jgi:hypothetical protein